MSRVHMSVQQSKLLQRYDHFLNAREDKANRYYILFLFFYKDYFLSKLVTKLMSAGHKQKALRVVVDMIHMLKRSVGFQPLFLFKHVVFKLRQLFKINTTTVRKKVTYLPVFLTANKQIAYGLGHIVTGARQLMKEERTTMAHALSVVFLNSFIRTAQLHVQHNKE